MSDHASPDRGPLPLEISCNDVAALRQQPPPMVLIDCRGPDEVDFCRIEGSRAIPLAEIENHLDWIQGQAADRIVVYCHHGVRSLRAANRLRALGIDRVQSMKGGIDAWSQLIDHSVPRY